MTVLKEQTTYSVVDTLQHKSFQTSQGLVPTDSSGWAHVDKDTAQEIQATTPGAIVIEHETPSGGQGYRGGGKRGGSMISMIEMPWKDNRYWFEKRDAQRDEDTAGRA